MKKSLNLEGRLRSRCEKRSRSLHCVASGNVLFNMPWGEVETVTPAHSLLATCGLLSLFSSERMDVISSWSIIAS